MRSGSRRHRSVFAMRAALAVSALLGLGFEAGSALGTGPPAAHVPAVQGAQVVVLGPGSRVRTVDDSFLGGGATAPEAVAAIRSGGQPPPSTGGVGLPGSGTTITAPITTPTTAPTTTTTASTTTPTATTPTSSTPTTTTTTTTTPGTGTHPGSGTTSKTPAAPTVVSVLAKLAGRRLITAAQEGQYLGEWSGALAAEQKLTGDRQAELTAVTETMHGIAAAGEMTASRLPALFLTLQANARWWTQGPLLSTDQRVQFNGSQIVWEYYPGQGIQLQPLATFGEANGMYTAGPADYAAMESLLAQMLPLAADEDGGITWDYYFPFDGGEPPWTSAMTDGTALEAFARAFEASRDNAYLLDGARILPVLRDSAPKGLSVPAAHGRRFLQYSFTPGTDIINAFLQTLVGLFVFSHISGNQLALTLFDQGNAEAQAELPSFNTGAWSLYQPGTEDTLSYHELVTGFLQVLCGLTAAPAYCQTATAFQADLTTPPVLAQRTFTAPAKKPFGLGFQLSKVARVGLAIVGVSRPKQGRTVFETSADYPHGTDSITVPALPAGTYAVHLSATDLAGNFSRIAGSLQVQG